MKHWGCQGSTEMLPAMLTQDCERERVTSLPRAKWQLTSLTGESQDLAYSSFPLIWWSRRESLAHYFQPCKRTGRKHIEADVLC